MDAHEAFLTILKQEDITQKALADKMGISYTTLSNTMRRSIPINTLLQVCDALDYAIVLEPKKGNKKERRVVIDSILVQREKGRRKEGVTGSLKV